MTATKLLGGGAAAALALGGGAALNHLAFPPGGSPAAAAPATRMVSDTSPSPARQVYDAAKGAVAFVSATTPQGQATGSGFVVDKSGLLVTNHHVIEGATQVGVKIGTDGRLRPAQVVGDDPSHDLALLKVDTGGTDLPTLSLGDTSSVRVGDATYAIGNPFGLDHTLTTGIVSALHRDIQAPDGSTISGAIQTDAALNPGNSGGALLDGAGQVIGVNAQIATGGQGQSGSVGIGFAIPAETVKAFIAQARNGQAAPQPAQSSQQPLVDPYGTQAQADPYGSALPG